MPYIFEIKDKSGRIIHLSEERLKHILSEHPALFNYTDELLKTLKEPIKILPSKSDENVKKYYKWLKNKRKYLIVVVKYLNNHGFIITSFFVGNIK